MKKFDIFLQEQLQDQEFKREYDNLQPEFDVIRAIVDARTSQKLTQKELAEKTGIDDPLKFVECFIHYDREVRSHES